MQRILVEVVNVDGDVALVDIVAVVAVPTVVVVVVVVVDGEGEDIAAVIRCATDGKLGLADCCAAACGVDDAIDEDG